MSDLLQKLNESVALAQENNRLRTLVGIQRKEIALLYFRLRATELKLHRQYEAAAGIPSLLRESA